MAQSNPPPSLPEVVDEAGNSPRWVPALGLGLFLLLAGLAALSFMRHPASQPTAAPTTEQAEEPAS
jgi:hypothetical protein